MAIKVLELYSGIGGMHFALKGSTIAEKSEVVLAIDINPICNEIYHHNFPYTPLLNKNLTSLNVGNINSVAPDIVLMSPPCQPFTRLGHQKDVKDARNDSFLRFIKLIPELNSVRYILIENVKGFEASKTRELLVSVLRETNFIIEEYLLNPRQFGICNSRLRYYLLARRTRNVNSNRIGKIITCPPENHENITHNMSQFSLPKCLIDVLEFDSTSPNWGSYSLSSKQLEKYFSLLDIVTSESENSCCFTRNYSRCMEGSGSVLTALSDREVRNLKEVNMDSRSGKIDNSSLTTLRLRFFTPQEIARLLTFPHNFSFPNHITRKERYKTIGNSINVFIVALLISHLVEEIL